MSAAIDIVARAVVSLLVLALDTAATRNEHMRVVADRTRYEDAIKSLVTHGVGDYAENAFYAHKLLSAADVHGGMLPDRIAALIAERDGVRRDYNTLSKAFDALDKERAAYAARVKHAHEVLNGAVTS